MPYSKMKWGWQSADPMPALGENAFRLWPHLATNNLMNRPGLYRASAETLAGIARMTVAEVKEALEELVEAHLMLYDSEANCLFLVNHIAENYLKEDGELRKDNKGKGLEMDLAEIAHLPLYPALLKAYPEVAALAPKPTVSRIDRINGATPPLPFPEEPPRQDAAPKAAGGRGGKAAEYRQLREKTDPKLLHVLDEAVDLLRAHSRQPRGKADWAGLLGDLKAVRILAKCRDTVDYLVPALRAVFAEGWEEMSYHLTGNGRVETVGGLGAAWPGGELKGVALVNRYLAACRTRGVDPEGGAAAEDDLADARAELRALEQSGVAGDEELEAARGRIRELEAARDA